MTTKRVVEVGRIVEGACKMAKTWTGYRWMPDHYLSGKVRGRTHFGPNVTVKAPNRHTAIKIIEAATSASAGYFVAARPAKPDEVLLSLDQLVERAAYGFAADYKSHAREIARNELMPLLADA